MPPTSGFSLFLFYENTNSYIFIIIIQIKITSMKPGDFFILTHKPNSSLPLGEMSRSDREGFWRALFEGAVICVAND